VICEKCRLKDGNAREINPDAVKVLRIILSKDWPTLSKLKIDSYSQRLLENISENVFHTFSPAHS